MRLLSRLVKPYLCSLGFHNYYRHLIHGDSNRLHWSKANDFQTIDAIFNTRSGHIYIGEGTIIGHGVMFLTGEHLFENGKLKQPRSAQVLESGNDIVIGSGCWIASGVIIIGGVTLGDNCIVGAGSVVTDSFPDCTFIVGGKAIEVRRI